MLSEKAFHASGQLRESLHDAETEPSLATHNPDLDHGMEETTVCDTKQGSLDQPDAPHLPISPWSNLAAFEDQMPQEGKPGHSEPVPIPTQLGEPRKSGVPEATQSPFTPEDSPVYELCPDSPVTKRVSPLKSVPEDAAAPSAEMLQPDELQLPVLRTPRKSCPAVPATLLSSSADLKEEEAWSLDFSAYHSGDLDAFNPFAQPDMSEATREDALAAQEMTHRPEPDFDQAFRDIPAKLGNLDFGSRHGGGVVGPKLERVTSTRSADRFEVKEGEDADVKQLLWVIENLQEELHISNTSFDQADQQAKERLAIISRLEEELRDARAHEAELEEKLNVSHSQLEAQLLQNLEQEEDIRLSGDKLRQTKSNITVLDEQLAKADTRRRQLETEAATRRAQSKTDSLEKKVAVPGASESPRVSAGSDYSSAWETSESEEDNGLDLEELQETRPSPTTIFEDNQAKMTEKGAKGGSWLRSVLGTMAKKEAAQDDSGKRIVFGAAHSHFEQPSTAAELTPVIDDATTADTEMQKQHSMPS